MRRQYFILFGLFAFSCGLFSSAPAIAKINTDGFFESEAEFERAQCALSEEAKIIQKTQKVSDEKLQDCQFVTSLALPEHLKLIELQVGTAPREENCSDNCKNSTALFLADHKDKKITPMPFDRKWVENKDARDQQFLDLLTKNISIDFTMGCSSLDTTLALAKNTEGTWGFKITLNSPYACGSHHPLEVLDDYQKETPYSDPKYRQLVRASFSEINWSGIAFVSRKGSKQEWDLSKLQKGNIIKEGLLIREQKNARVVFGQEAKSILEDYYARH